MAHEPGPQTLMGRTFPARRGGWDRGAGVPRQSSGDPSRISPPSSCAISSRMTPRRTRCRRSRGCCANTSGDLGAASEALIGIGGLAARTTSCGRRWIFIVQRCARLTFRAPFKMLNALGTLGQPLWAAPQPNGWPDRADDWAAPEAMLRRIDWARALPAASETATCRTNWLMAALGPLLRPATRDAIRRAGSRRDAMTLLLTSPEFQRR